MMTDKATVEMESPVAGKVVELAGEVGDQIPIGSVLVVIETEGEDRAAETAADSEDERPLADGAVEADPGAGRRDADRRRSSERPTRRAGAEPQSKAPRQGRARSRPATTLGTSEAQGPRLPRRRASAPATSASTLRR